MPETPSDNPVTSVSSATPALSSTSASVEKSGSLVGFGQVAVVMPFPIIKASLTLIGVSVLLGLVVWAGLNMWAGEGAGEGDVWGGVVGVSLLALGVCLGAGLVAFVPIWLMSRKSFQGAAMGFMLGILIRMALCGAVVVRATQSQWEQGTTFSYWIAGWYLVLLTIEIKLLSSHISTVTQAQSAMDLPAASQTPPSDSETV